MGHALRIRPGMMTARAATFLAAFAKCGGLHRAAEIAGCDVRTHYRWMQTIPEYPALFAEAQRKSIEVLENEARRRATLGVEKGVYWQGQLIAKEKVYSDPLLMFLLRGLAKDKYADHQVIESKNLNQNANLNVDMAALMKRLTPEQLRTLEDIAAALAAPSDGPETPKPDGHAGQSNPAVSPPDRRTGRNGKA